MLVRKALIERALDFNIILDDVSLTELAFSPQYSAAVEAKQVGLGCACVIHGVPLLTPVFFHFPHYGDDRDHNSVQVAAQEAQRASFLVERAKQQRQEKIVQAEGEAASAKLVGSV